MNKLRALHAHGQSVWLDFIRRDMLTSGELASHVSNGIRGLTSNPTIFQQAIALSDAYDNQIRTITTTRPTITTLEVFERLAVQDIQNAADVLRPIYDASNGEDGFVSLEVSPHLAYDTAGTISEAKRLWEWVNRPNLMIKVPATNEGIPAFEELISSGLNINVTVLFALDYYQRVAQAYVRGLSRAQNPGSIASVASFFVSRVDSATDTALGKVGTDQALALQGTIAVANAKLAYRRYGEIFASKDFAEVAARGGKPQRVLWASTSTKNPKYSDLLYVNSLVGANTVNTMPPITLNAFRDHGIIDGTALTTAIDEAEDRISSLSSLDIKFKKITDDLTEEAVTKFAESFDDLLTTLSQKIESLSA